MIKLYFAPRTRSTRPRWLLEELGVPYELVRLDLEKGEHKQPEYLAIHPHGVVPALIDDGMRLMESVAICAYLADKFPEKGFAPPPGSKERGEYYQWLFYGAATLEASLVKFFENGTGDEAERDVELAAEAKKEFELCADVLTKALGSREFIVGSSFTTADVILGSMLSWARAMKLTSSFAQLESYVKRLTERPAFRRAQS